jgi:hypothetical protein
MLRIDNSQTASALVTVTSGLLNTGIDERSGSLHVLARLCETFQPAWQLPRLSNAPSPSIVSSQREPRRVSIPVIAEFMNPSPHACLSTPTFVRSTRGTWPAGGLPAAMSSADISITLRPRRVGVLCSTPPGAVSGGPFIAAAGNSTDAWRSVSFDIHRWPGWLNLLEQQDVRLWLVHLIVFPP